MPEHSSRSEDEQDNSDLKDLSASSSEKSHLSVSELGERVAAEVHIDGEKALRAVQIVQEYSQMYSGPIPSAHEIQRLNAVDPGLGTSIAHDFLTHRAHERSMDLHVVELARTDSDRKDGWLKYARRGQNYGMISQCLFLAAALIAMYAHQVVLAGLFVAGPALGVASQFIKGIFEQTKESSGSTSSKPSSSEADRNQENSSD